MTPNPKALAEEALPCVNGITKVCHGGRHWSGHAPWCQARFRPAVEAAIRKALDEATKERDALLKGVHFTQRFGTPFDPTGAKIGTEIVALREKMAAQDQQIIKLVAALKDYEYRNNLAIQGEAKDWMKKHDDLRAAVREHAAIVVEALKLWLESLPGSRGRVKRALAFFDGMMK